MNNFIKRLVMWALVVAVILSIPHFGQWPWTSFDFTFAGIVLLGSATVYELATQNIKNKTHKVAVAIAVIVFLILIQAWAVA